MKQSPWAKALWMLKLPRIGIMAEGDIDSLRGRSKAEAKAVKKKWTKRKKLARQKKRKK